MFSQVGENKWWCIWVVVALIVLVGVGMSAAPVWAQEAEAGDDEDIPVDAVDLATPSGQRLQQGISYYDQANYVAASHLFHLIYSDFETGDAVPLYL